MFYRFWLCRLALPLVQDRSSTDRENMAFRFSIYFTSFPGLLQYRAGVLYQHIKTRREASFINGFKKDQSYELIDKEILKIHKV